MKKKRSKIFIILAISFVFISSIVNANYTKINKTDLATFVKEGEVKVLKRDNDRYFIKKEYFDKDGFYTQPAVEKEIDALEYSILRKSLDFDVLETNLNKDINGEKILAYQVVDTNGNLLNGSFVSHIDEDNNFKLTFNQPGDKKVLISQDDRYFIKTLSVDKNNDYTKNAVITEVEKEVFEEEQIKGKFNYLHEIQNAKNENNLITKITYYDSDMEPINDTIEAVHDETKALRDYANANKELNDDSINDKIKDIDNEKLKNLNNNDIDNNEEGHNISIEDIFENYDPTGTGAGSIDDEDWTEDFDNSLEDHFPDNTGDPVIDWDDIFNNQWNNNNYENQKPDSNESNDNNVVDFDDWDTPSLSDVDPDLPSKVINDDEEDINDFGPSSTPSMNDYYDNIWDTVYEEQSQITNRPNNTNNIGNNTTNNLNNTNNDIDLEQIIDKETEQSILDNLLGDNEINNLINPSDKQGYLDDAGNFIETDEDGNVKTKVPGKFDHDGNFWPEGKNYYFDMYGIRHLVEDINLKAKYDENGNFYNGTDAYFDVSGLLHPIKQGKGGYYDKNRNFILDDNSGYIDPDGYFHEFIKKDQLRFDKVDLDKNTKLTTDKFGRLKIIGLKGFFYNDGLYNSPNGKKGFFNSKGEFIENKSNLYKIKGGFYDNDGNWYSFKEFYKDNLGENKVVLSPDLDIKIKDNKIQIGNLKGTFDINGLYTVNGRTGYFDENGSFVEAKLNPYKGGFYALGEWIHSSFFQESNGQIKLNLGEFDNFGNYKTAYDDLGHFNNKGEFIPFQLNSNKEHFYDSQGKKYLFGRSYKDDLGNVFTLGKSSFYTKAGVKIDGEYVLGQKTNKGKLMYNGAVIDNNKVGYFDEDGNFNIGSIPYNNGYYNQNGDYIKVEKSVHKRGEANIYGQYIVLNNHVILPNGMQILANRDSKMNLTFGGLVINELGDLGFYNSNGDFTNITNIKDFVVEKDGKVGYYNANGEFVTTMDENKGFYDQDNNYHFYNNDDFFDTNGNLQKSDGTIWYYNAEGKLIEGTNPYANGFFVEKDNFVGEGEPQLKFFNDAGVLITGKELPYKDGFYDKFRNFHAFEQADGFIKEEVAQEADKDTMILSNGIKVDKDLNVLYPNGKTETAIKDKIKDKMYILLSNNIAISEDGTYGEIINDKYTKKGDLKVIGDDGKLLSDGKIVLLDGTIIEPDGTIKKAFVDENKTIYLGDGKYMKADGTVGRKEKFYGYQDKNGTVYKTGPNAIGVFDDNGNFIPNNQDGFYDNLGTYREDNNLFGYYDNKGDFIANQENIYNDGFYDANKNWHLFGDKGYYKSNGDYVKDVKDIEIGYYNKDGVYILGSNPYVKGFYNENGHWFEHGLHGYFDTQGTYVYTENDEMKKGHFNKDGQLIDGENPFVDGYFNHKGEFTKFVNGQSTKYYTKSGEEKIGVSPYINGFYDNMKNWHSFSEKGYYTIGGTFVDKDNNLGYYDKDGAYNEGFNAYLYGYYDVDNNWHPFESKGFYSADGTFNAENGTIGYFTKDGKFIKNKRASNPEGFYDEFGNYIPFDEDGFYNPRGQFIPDKYYESIYEYGNEEYIYNEGYFANGIPNILNKNSKTLQYTIDKKQLNPIYVETGIKVPGNFVVDFEDISDALHGIAINTNGRFIKDYDYSMLIYNGRIVKLERDKGVTVNEIKRMFADTKLDLEIRNTRVGDDFRIVDAIETKQPISIFIEDYKYDIQKPLISKNNEAYISINDIAAITDYKVSINPEGPTSVVTFIKDVKGEERQELNLIVGSKVFELNKNNVNKFNTPVIKENIDKEEVIYAPIDLLDILTDKNLYWDAWNYRFNITNDDLVGKEAK